MGATLPDPAHRLERVLRDLDRRLAAVERGTLRGLRFTAEDGARAELRVFDDGSVGLRVYDSAGNLDHDLTAT